MHTKGHFTHETESPWPIHFKHSCWWKRRSRSKFASHCARGTNGACECKMGVMSTRIPTWHQMDHVSWSLGYFHKPPLGYKTTGRPWHFKCSHPLISSISSCVRTCTNRSHWNSIWLRTLSHMPSYYTRGRVTTPRDLGGVLGQPLDTCFH